MEVQILQNIRFIYKNLALKPILPKVIVKFVPLYIEDLTQGLAKAFIFLIKM